MSVVMGRLARAAMGRGHPNDRHRTSLPQMSERNIEIVRRGFDAFESMDMDAFTADWHPDMLWDVRGYRHWPGLRQQYRGPAEILAEFANFMGTVKGLEVTVHEIVALDSERVLSIYTERRRNEGDLAPVALDIGIVYTLANGQVTRIEVYTGHHEARRAAGVA